MPKRNIQDAPNLARLKKWASDHDAGDLKQYEKGPDLRYGDYLEGLDSAGNTVKLVGVDSGGYATVPATIPGRGALKLATAVFDPSAVAGQRTKAAHALGPVIPDKSLIIQSWYEGITTCHSPSTGAGVDKATIAISINGANDLVTATAIETGTTWDDAAPVDCVPDGTAAKFIKLTADRQVTFTVAVDPLDAGKVVCYVLYCEGL